jgi:hypothetical protein
MHLATLQDERVVGLALLSPSERPANGGAETPVATAIRAFGSDESSNLSPSAPAINCMIMRFLGILCSQSRLLT